MVSTLPTIVLIGGPNGAGKSTIAPSILERAFGKIEFVNADTIASGLSGLDPSREAFAAGRIMLRHIKDMAAARRSFSFESTLSSRTFAPFLQKLIADGYAVHLIYIWVRTPEIAVERVRARVASGGHFVPEETVRRRYTRSIQNLFDLYMPLASAWEVVDNSRTEKCEIIASSGSSGNMIIHDQRTWNQFEQFRGK